MDIFRLERNIVKITQFSILALTPLLVNILMQVFEKFVSTSANIKNYILSCHHIGHTMPLLTTYISVEKWKSIKL